MNNVICKFKYPSNHIQGHWNWTNPFPKLIQDFEDIDFCLFASRGDTDSESVPVWVAWALECTLLVPELNPWQSQVWAGPGELLETPPDLQQLWGHWHCAHHLTRNGPLIFPAPYWKTVYCTAQNQPIYDRNCKKLTTLFLWFIQPLAPGIRFFI